METNNVTTRTVEQVVVLLHSTQGHQRA